LFLASTASEITGSGTKIGSCKKVIMLVDYLAIHLNQKNKVKKVELNLRENYSETFALITIDTYHG